MQEIKMTRRLGLFLKLVIIMTGLAALPLALVGTKIIGINKHATQDAILELHTKLVEKLSYQIDSDMKTLDTQLRLMVVYQLSQKVPWEDKEKYLVQLIEENPELVVSVALVDAQGNELIRAFSRQFESSDSPVNHAQDPTFRAWASSGKESRKIRLAQSHAFLDIYYPFQKGFALFLTHSLEPIQSAVAKEQVGGTGYAFLVDAQGRILAHPDSSQIGKTAEGMSIVPQALEAVSLGSSEFRDPSGVFQVGAYAPIRSLGGAVMILQPKSEAYSSVRKIQRLGVILLVVSLIIAVLAAFWMARMVSRPVLALLAEQKKTEAIIFSIADGIIMTDHAGRIQLLNERARTILQFPDGDLTGKLLKDLWNDPRFEAVVQEISQNPDQNQTREIDLSSGEVRRFYQVSAQPVRTPSQVEELGIVTVYHDITLEKELEQMKEDFLHTITHDLRNPMTSIRGFLSFLKTGTAGPLSDSQKKILDTMDRASYRLLGMINDILDLAKLESGGLKLALSDCRLEEIGRGVLEIQQPLAAKKSIVIEFQTAQPHAVIRADSNMLERTITNLVGNAVKFTPEHGRITLAFQERPEDILFWVKDTGEGIPADYLDKVFKKFQQVGERRSGSGLGLTICKYFVEAHGGKIWVESKVGAGSTFFFTIPKSVVQSEKEAA